MPDWTCSSTAPSARGRSARRLPSSARSRWRRPGSPGVDEDAYGAAGRACIRAETEVAGAPTAGWTRRSRCRRPARRCSSTSATAPAVPLDLAEPPHAPGHRHPRAAPAHRRRVRRPAGRLREAAAALGVPPCAQAPGRGRGLADERVRRRARHMVTEIARVEQTVTPWSAATGPRSATVRRLARLDAGRLRDLLPRARLAVATAVEAGAVGARMTGGGFGGSTISGGAERAGRGGRPGHRQRLRRARASGAPAT